MNKNDFDSEFKKLGKTILPKASGKRIMMMPIVLGDLQSLPDFMAEWEDTMRQLFEMGGRPGEIGYITIDEKLVDTGDTHRRAGKHVDGVHNGGVGGWGPANTGGGWGGVGSGMLTVASHVGCIAWNQNFVGWPGKDGECDHLADQCKNGTVFRANEVYWLDGLCVHESIPQLEPVFRQFVRLSMPSVAPWFTGYTENPLGIKPTGPILSRRIFMDM